MRIPEPGPVHPGLRLPPLEITTTLEDLVRWSAAADDYTTFHYDSAAARDRGFAGPVVHGTFQASQIGRMLQEWLGPGGDLTGLSCRYRRPVIVGEPLSCHAEVAAVEEGNGARLITLEVWTESPAGEVATTGMATARVPVAEVPIGPAPLVTDELIAEFRIGEVIGRYTFPVTAERIRRYSAVLADRSLEEALVHQPDLEERFGVAPAAFFALLDPLELKFMSHDRGLDLIPFRRTGGGNAFNEIHYDRPIRAGDLITVEVAYTEVYEKTGRSGPLLFRVRENTLSDAAGERVGLARSGHVYSFEVPGYGPPARRDRAAATGEPEGELLPPLVRVPTTQTLVRYAAAADDYAPLHYDHLYARTRGYDGVIVHGFLKAGYMGQMLEDWAGPGSFVASFRAEYRGPDYPDLPITAGGRVTRSYERDGRSAADVELWTAREDGSISTRGTATVLLPVR